MNLKNSSNEHENSLITKSCSNEHKSKKKIQINIRTV